jgi:hypothetical protein
VKNSFALKIAKWVGITSAALFVLFGLAMLIMLRYDLASDEPMAFWFFVISGLLGSMVFASLICIAALKWSRLSN